MSVKKEVSVVDLSRGVTPAFIDRFGKALKEHGFVSVVGHGVDSGLLKGVYDTALRVFDLSEAAKKRYETPENGRQTGYTSFGIERAKDNPRPDLKEFWHVYRPGHEVANIFPAEVPEFEGLCLSLYGTLDVLAQKLLGAVGDYLSKPQGFFQEWARGGNNLLRILNYPELPPGVEGLRSAPHEDINLITLLPAATHAGLELKTRDGTWLPINNPPDAIIVNSGDMLQIHTGNHPGRLDEPGYPDMPSTTHQVTNLPGRRLSLPYFVHPRSEVPLVTANDYLVRRLKEIGLFAK